MGISIGGDGLKAQARHEVLAESVNMPVVDVWVVRVGVRHCSVFVPVAVTVWVAPAWFMLMLMVFIVAVFVLMLQLMVDVFMPMVFSQVQPHA